jgi:hypothetical protein
MRPTIVLVSILICASLISPAQKVASALRPPNASPTTREMPFEIHSNKPWVQVRINCSEPQWFILDTGCRQSSIIARECADRLHLKVENLVELNVGAGQGVKVAFGSTPDVTLGIAGGTLHSLALGVTTLNHVEPYEGRHLDGLLGEDFMRRHVVEIDYARRRIRIHDPETYRHEGPGTPIPISFHGGLVVAAARMKPPGREAIDCHVVIDTGVRTTVVWYHPFVVEHDFVASQPRFITGTVGGGAGGETTGDIGRLDSLRIGALDVLNPTVVFSRDTSGVFAGHAEDGIVGGELLRRCKVTFDYPHERFYLDPYSAPVSGFDYDMSGLFLVSGGEDLKHVTIQSVSERTPASEAGLAKGDEIVSLDGRATADLSLDQVRDLLKKNGMTYRLGVKRAGESLAIRLTLRRLV